MDSPFSVDIGRWISLLKDADESKLLDIQADMCANRQRWLEENSACLSSLQGDDLERAYGIILLKVGIEEHEAPVVFKDSGMIIFHSKNPCPSLTACMALGLDTRIICRRVLEKPADLLVKRINPRLTFSRNYTVIRPYSPYCEEVISIV